MDFLKFSTSHHPYNALNNMEKAVVRMTSQFGTSSRIGVLWCRRRLQCCDQNFSKKQCCWLTLAASMKFSENDISQKEWEYLLIKYHIQYIRIWYSSPSSNLKLAASSRLWAKMQGFSSYVVFFQKYTNVLIFWSRLYTGKIKTWKVQRGTSKMVLFYVKNLTVSLSLLWKANMQVFKVHKFDLTFSIVDGWSYTRNLVVYL